MAGADRTAKELSFARCMLMNKTSREVAIGAAFFVLFVSCNENPGKRERFFRTSCMHSRMENRNTTVVPDESIAPLGAFNAFHRVVRKS